MRVLVTGAAGFLGAECVRQLAQSGHDVVTTDRHGEVAIRIDLAEPSACRRLPDVDAVVHSAAVQYVSDDLPLWRRASYFHRNNVVASHQLIERYAGTGAHFVNVGTSMMYAQTGRDLYDVTSAMRGRGLYSASKVAVQREVERMTNPHTCVIPCIIAGSGRGGLFASLVRSMARWRVAIVPGGGRHKTHLVHVDDVASLICLVVEKRATGLFNAAAPQPLSIDEWITIIASELGLTSVRRVHPSLAGVTLISRATGYRVLAAEQLLMLQMPHVLSIAESLALGWSPQFDNARIVRDTARGLAALTAAS
jgi:nucleoside-diphosphate-sugar epimerase